MRKNPLMGGDSYKHSHGPLWRRGLQYVYAYFENRSGGLWPETVPFGLQYILMEHFVGSRITIADIDEAEMLLGQHFGHDIFNRKGWESILYNHGGCFPVSIKAVPEGTPVPEGNILMSVTNTCDGADHDPGLCAFIVNFIETILVQFWYPTTIATASRENKKVILAALEKSGTPESIGVKLHDFGFRGSTSYESSAIGGAAHLVNFIGTDTLSAVMMLREYYGADMPGISVAASEHSTISSWGPDGELEAMRNALKVYTKGYVSLVSDTWDIYHACAMIFGRELRDEILGNKERTVVIRPDSGDPHHTLPKILDILGTAFGYTINDKGYRVLPDQVRVIQGDGIDRHTIPTILEAVMTSNGTEEKGWSIDNLVLGSGGGLLQKFVRDDTCSAFKCSAVYADGEWHDVYKMPSSDVTKASKKGRLKLISDPLIGLTTVAHDTPGTDRLVEVFRDGEMLIKWTLDEIRERAAL